MKNTSEIHIRNYHDDDFVTLIVAGRLVGMSVSFMKTLKNRGEIPYYQIGGSIRFKISDLKEYIARCRVESGQKGTVQDASRQ